MACPERCVSCDGTLRVEVVGNSSVATCLDCGLVMRSTWIENTQEPVDLSNLDGIQVGTVCPHNTICIYTGDCLDCGTTCGSL